MISSNVRHWQNDEGRLEDNRARLAAHPCKPALQQLASRCTDQLTRMLHFMQTEIVMGHHAIPTFARK